ncbi:type II toxin-antitoxin system Phd/YefM family antitoxin [Spartinivicinus poritis]|uniref:Antitoxin n=1 Tax=Spartinivicinus poritis TaxID=2994640 RepID=A0ABT5U881_9GAMM|nr:type II toxin-antitoxin system Phd/YefM family antitoxin [Spartinivicinus sp. A2-2]MDE1462578.1 type II toxin-antitoxin system Phd/YefM family antitoxin [Spartinivicinus sp. A2-2]
MKTVKSIFADFSVSITDFKQNPMAVVEQAEGEAVVVLDHNQPVFYCVPAEAYELLMDKLEDAELAAVIESRKVQSEQEVSINDL